MQNQEEQKIAAVVLAAGKGTRMKSEQAKVLHQVLGKPVIFRVLQALKGINCSRSIIVVGHQAEQVKAYCETQFTDCLFAEQPVQNGSGHAVQMALPHLSNFEGYVLILNGDMPLLDVSALQKVINAAQAGNYALTLLTADSSDHRDFGRIVRNSDNCVERIVEAKDCTPEEYKITEVNIGVYCAQADFLRRFLPQLTPSNAQGELYLTDLVGLGRAAGEEIGAVIGQVDYALGVNTRADLAKAAAALKERKLTDLMISGVSIIDPQSVWIEDSVTIGKDSVIWPGTVLQGGTVIGDRCQIGPNSQITDSTIGNNSNIVHSVLNDAIVGSGVNVGPFAYLRPRANIADRAKVGDFVEIKNANIGEDTKVPHLTYIGDADIGSGTNIGCGTITCNYDGKAKHRTTIGDRVFIGSNSSLVAPVTVGSGAKTGAGAVVVHDVSENSVVVGVPARPIHHRQIAEGK
ncbi:MAG: bifunctional UDP-N-acetylglucosamine diphosphorylase/glucosamine-1-phosphate N-acetyltransferase GlmU [Candidatus Bruticola sp.]